MDTAKNDTNTQNQQKHQPHISRVGMFCCNSIDTIYGAAIHIYDILQYPHNIYDDSTQVRVDIINQHTVYLIVL